jgi:hypothetical protein
MTQQHFHICPRTLTVPTLTTKGKLNIGLMLIAAVRLYTKKVQSNVEELGGAWQLGPTMIVSATQDMIISLATVLETSAITTYVMHAKKNLIMLKIYNH